MGLDSHFAPGFRGNYQETIKLRAVHREVGNYNNQITIRIPDCRILSLIARSLLLFIVIVSLPRIGSILRRRETASGGLPRPEIHRPNFLPMLFRDLANLGLVQSGDRAVSIGSGDRRIARIFKDMNMNVNIHVVSKLDFQKQRLVKDNSLDFVFADDFANAAFVDRTLKVGGIAIVLLRNNPSAGSFRIPPNFKIVYLRHFDTTVVTVRKTGGVVGGVRRLLALPYAEREVLKGLEDVLLEPPRSHRKNPRKTKYLPDLIDDLLDKYPRRVFIDVGGPGSKSGAGWFKRHYPTRNREFEMYKVVAVGPEAAVKATIDMTEWLRKNVDEEEYVVMKADAEVVEEILRSKAIFLVDELFMECRHEGQRGKKKGERSRRPYWECLSLYGKLRDEGVAVHQWWG